MTNSFQSNPEEAVLLRSGPSHQWYILALRIGVGILEVIIFIFLSFISLTNIGKTVLATFLPLSLADGLSRVLFQGIVPILITAWFTEDTARIFTSELILTSQRIWTKGSPYAWSSGQEIPLINIKSISARRDAIFIHLKNTKKVEVLVFPNGKQIVDAYTQFTEKTEAA